MKIIVAIVVLMSVAAASAGVTENVKVYNPTQMVKTVKVIKPVR